MQRPSGKDLMKALIYLDLSDTEVGSGNQKSRVETVHRGAKDFHYLKCSCFKEQKWSPCVIQLSFYHIYLILPL